MRLNSPSSKGKWFIQSCLYLVMYFLALEMNYVLSTVRMNNATVVGINELHTLIQQSFTL